MSSGLSMVRLRGVSVNRGAVNRGPTLRFFFYIPSSLYQAYCLNLF
jgi:hypothetical protein